MFVRLFHAFTGGYLTCVHLQMAAYAVDDANNLILVPPPASYSTWLFVPIQYMCYKAVRKALMVRSPSCLSSLTQFYETIQIGVFPGLRLVQYSD